MSVNPSTEPWSLYNSFISGPASNYGVTNLIHELILSLSHDVCTLKRNALITYKLLSRATTLYNEVTKLIETVETETLESWDTYDKYTLAIAPLEDLLLKLGHLVDFESKAWLPTDTKVVDLILSVKTWQDHRIELRGLFDSNGFYSDTNLQAVNNDTTDAEPLHFRDNWTFLNALCRGIDGFDLKLLTSVKQEAHKILPKITDTTTDGSMEETIRSMMLVYGAVVVLNGEMETDECKARLASETLWEKAKKLLSSVVDHLSLLPTSIDVAALKSEVDAFITFLKAGTSLDFHPTGPAQLPSSYWELKKAVRNVRRPYHAQTLAAVKQARDLAVHFSKLPEDQSYAKVQTLEAAIDAVRKAFEAAALAVISILSFDQQGAEAQKAKDAFTVAEEKLTACFTDYGAKATGMSMVDAKAKDDEYVTSMKAHFKDGSKTRPTPKGANVKLIRVKAGVPRPPKSYSMDESTCLSAILWKEADSDPTVRLQSSHFKLNPRDGDDKKLHLEATIHDIGLKGGKLTVYLVVD